MSSSTAGSQSALNIAVMDVEEEEVSNSSGATGSNTGSGGSDDWLDVIVLEATEVTTQSKVSQRRFPSGIFFRHTRRSAV